MANKLRKFRYTSGHDVDGQIHIEGDQFNTFETLCGCCDTFGNQEDTDEYPTCYGCLSTYKLIKNGTIGNR